MNVKQKICALSRHPQHKLAALKFTAFPENLILETMPGAYNSSIFVDYLLCTLEL